MEGMNKMNPFLKGYLKGGIVGGIAESAKNKSTEQKISKIVDPQSMAMEAVSCKVNISDLKAMVHVYNGYVLRIDMANSILQLRSNFNKTFVEKSYHFSAVRHWSYQLQNDTPSVMGRTYMGGGGARQFGTDVGTSLGNYILASRTLNENKENTGLFFEVKDTQYPMWRIAFEYSKKSTDFVLRQWMELLTQCLNETDEEHFNAHKTIAPDVQNCLRYCSSCGSKTSLTDAFCSACGAKLHL